MKDEQKIMDKITKRLNFLKEMENFHLKEAEQLINLKTQIHVLDMISIPVYNRSMALISGFTLMIERENFICAAPLIRLQIDNYLRFFATSLVEDVSEFVLKVMDGEKISNFRDFKTGRRLYDKYLISKAKKFTPWIEKVYEETSGYIHFSSKHIFNSIAKGDDKYEFSMKVGEKDSLIPNSLKLEAIEAMINITRLVLTSLKDWRNHKNTYFRESDGNG